MFEEYVDLSRLLLLVIIMALDTDTLNFISLSHAHFSIVAGLEFA